MRSEQSKKSRFLLWPALAAAIAVGGVTSYALAEGSSSPAEVQRGVPGVDVDLNANGKHGLDVDMQAGNKNDNDNGVPGVDADVNTRTLGAGSDTHVAGKGPMRAPIHDRN